MTTGSRTGGPTGRRRPPGRYDERSTSRTGVAVLGAVVVLAGLAVAWFTFQRYGRPPAVADVTRYSVVSDELVQVTVRVRKDPAADVTCSVRARDLSGAEIVRERVAFGPAPGGERTTERTVELRTSRRAVTGEAGRCTAREEPAAP